MKSEDRYLSRNLNREFRAYCDEYKRLRSETSGEILKEVEANLIQWVKDYQSQHSELLKHIWEIFPPDSNSSIAGMFNPDHNELYDLVRCINLQMNVERARAFPYVLNINIVPEVIINPIKEVITSRNNIEKYIDRLTVFLELCIDKYKYVDILVAQVPELKPGVHERYYKHVPIPKGSYYSVDNFIKEGYNPKEFTQFFALCSAEGIQLNASK